MAAETAVLLFLTFFQLAGALALAQPRASNAEARRLLAALLVLNATLTGIRALEIEGGPRVWLDTTRALVDLPSALLILAVVLALRPEERMRRAAIAVGVISLAHPILAVLAPPLLTQHYTLFFAVPYHLAVAALLWTASKGDGESRWIALAFLPRALYFVVQGLDALFIAGVASREFPHYVVLAGVAAVCVVAIRRLWAAASDSDAPVGPPTSLIVVAAIVGPAIAIAQVSFRGLEAPPGIIILDYLTLSLARPAFLYMGLVPGRVGPLAINSLAAAGIGAIVDYGAAELMGFPGPAATLVGFALGLSALAVADGLGSGRRPQLSAAASPADPDPTPVEIGGPHPDDAHDDIPHWQRILLELQGSSGHAQAGPADPRWTQKELAARTGISVKRVSEFPHHLNAQADARLDTFLPAWRDERKGRPPTLVEVHRGAVRGLAGARVFYSLTPWGERLAAAVAERVGRTYYDDQTTTTSSESFSELDGQNAARIADR